MRELLLDEIRRSVRSAYPGVDSDVLDRFTLDPPRDPTHGDFATNAAFLLKDVVRESPRRIAEALVGKLSGGLSDAEVAGPGFINFRIRPQGVHAFLRRLANAKDRGALLADPDLARELGLTQIEFVSANPTGPMNVVSARAAAYGDACVRLLRAAGCDVRAEYYVNDEGNQAKLFGASLEARFLQAAGVEAELPEDGYRGEYVVDLARSMWRSARSPQGKEAALAVSRRIDFAREGLERMVAAARRSLAAFGVEFDEWFHESWLHRAAPGAPRRVDEAEALLRARGHLREADGATWFVSTAFGDDKDRVIRRSGGPPTYLLGDVAYHLDKSRRGFAHVVDVWGPDHHGYIKRLHSATVALGLPEDWLRVVIVQQVNLLRDGDPVKMSKRGGELVTLDELVEEVGRDASRFFFLMRRASTHLDFDLELAKRESMENPVYYVQYAHARSRSIFRQPMADRILRDRGEADLSLLTAEEEVSMMRTLLQYPQTVRESARALEPHRLVAFLREVAQTYHRFYTRGRNDPSFRVLADDEELARARLFLVGTLAEVLQEGLGLLGIRAVDHM
jgi:arginyl-tRNA synthetase